MDHDQESTEASEERVISVKLTGLEDVAPQYVNVVHANNDREIFQIIFSLVSPPTALRTEDLEELRTAGTIPGKVVARLLFTPRVVEEMVDVLQTQLARYGETQQKMSQESAGDVNE